MHVVQKGNHKGMQGKRIQAQVQKASQNIALEILSRDTGRDILHPYYSVPTVHFNITESCKRQFLPTEETVTLVCRMTHIFTLNSFVEDRQNVMLQLL